MATVSFASLGAMNSKKAPLLGNGVRLTGSNYVPLMKEVGVIIDSTRLSRGKSARSSAQLR